MLYADLQATFPSDWDAARSRAAHTSVVLAIKVDELARRGATATIHSPGHQTSSESNIGSAY